MLASMINFHDAIPNGFATLQTGRKLHLMTSSAAIEPERAGVACLHRSVSNGMLERDTHNSRLSVFDSDNVRLDLAVHRSAPEPPGDSFSRNVGCFGEP